MFLVWLEKLVERGGVGFGVSSKMADFIRRNILSRWVKCFFTTSLQSLHSVTTYTPNCDCSIDAAETLLLTMKRGKKLDYNHFDWKSKFAFDIDLYQYSRCHIMISRNMKLICKVVISCHNKIRDPSKIQGDPRDCVLQFVSDGPKKSNKLHNPVIFGKLISGHFDILMSQYSQVTNSCTSWLCQNRHWQESRSREILEEKWLTVFPLKLERWIFISRSPLDFQDFEKKILFLLSFLKILYWNSLSPLDFQDF